jgi:hypothetical protein
MKMTEIDIAKKYLRKIDVLLIDLTNEVSVDGLPDEAGKAIIIIANKVKKALEILELEE